jgi:hypothetical protein
MQQQAAALAAAVQRAIIQEHQERQIKAMQAEVCPSTMPAAAEAEQEGLVILLPLAEEQMAALVALEFLHQ